MNIRTIILAENAAAAWTLCFIADELDLFVEFAAGGTAPAPEDRISIDDFLGWRPRDGLHEQALKAFVGWLYAAMQRGI